MDQFFIEPFCGGCNVIDKVDGRRIANDKNIWLYRFWKYVLKKKDIATRISREEYNVLRDMYMGRTAMTADPLYVAYVGFVSSFNGKFFSGGYSGGNQNRNYIFEAYKNIINQRENCVGYILRTRITGTC